MKWTAVSLLAFLPLFFLVIAPLLTSWMLSNASTRPDDAARARTPSDLGCEFSEARFQSRDGIQLTGWLLPGSEANPAFIIAHGFVRNRQEVLQLACRLSKAGYASLLFDSRSHRSHYGASGASPVTLGYQERLDVLGAYDYLSSKRENPRFVLAGVSMGAAAVIHAAAEIAPQLDGIIADSPFLNLNETVGRHVELFLNLPRFPFVPIFVWNFSRLGGFEAQELDNAEALGLLRQVPILLVYGEDDRRMPAEVAQGLLEAVPHASKRLVYFPKAGHGDAFESDPERYLATIFDFLQENPAVP